MGFIKRYVPFILIFGILFATYYPVWTGYYLHTDGYFWSKWGSFSRHDVLRFAMHQGRPLTGFLYSFFVYIGKLAWMNLVRFLSVGSLSVAAFLLFYWFCFHKFDRWFSCFLSVSVFTLPPFQVFASLEAAAPYGIAVILSILALMFVNRGVGLKIKGSLLFYGAGIFLLVMAFSLYQCNACFYLTLLVVPLLKEKNVISITFWRKMFIYLLVFACASALYYFFWIGWLQWAAIPNVGELRDGRCFVPDLGLRWKWFMEGPLVEASNFWNIIPSRRASNFFIGFLGTVLLCSFIVQIRNAVLNIKLIICEGLRYLVLLLLIPASFFIILVCSDPPMGYRTYAALSTTLLLLTILPVVCSENIKYRMLLSGTMFFLMIFGVCRAYATVDNYIAIPDSKEIRYVMHSIRDAQVHGQADFSNVLVLMINHPVAPTQRNEIGEPSTGWGPNIRPIVMTAFNELGVKKKVRVFCCYRQDMRLWLEYGLVFGKDPQDLLSQWVYPKDHTLIVDMGKINDWR